MIRLDGASETACRSAYSRFASISTAPLNRAESGALRAPDESEFTLAITTSISRNYIACHCHFAPMSHQSEPRHIGHGMHTTVARDDAGSLLVQKGHRLHCAVDPRILRLTLFERGRDDTGADGFGQNKHIVFLARTLVCKGDGADQSNASHRIAKHHLCIAHALLPTDNCATCLTHLG